MKNFLGAASYAPFSRFEEESTSDLSGGEPFIPRRLHILSGLSPTPSKVTQEHRVSRRRIQIVELTLAVAQSERKSHPRFPPHQNVLRRSPVGLSFGLLQIFTPSRSFLQFNDIPTMRR